MWTQDIGGALSARQWWQLLAPLARVVASLLHDLRLEHPFRRHLLAAFKAGSRAVPAGRIRCGNRYAAFPHNPRRPPTANPTSEPLTQLREAFPRKRGARLPWS